MKISGFIYTTLIASVTIICFSCKKSSSPSTTNNTTNTNNTTTPPSPYYLKILKNGTWVNYGTPLGTVGADEGDATYQDLEVEGAIGSNDIFDLDIQILSSTFPTGNYSTDSTANNMDIDETVISGNNAFDFGLGSSPDSTKASSYLVKITGITSTAITGTFTGNYLVNGFGNDSVITVTQGQFNVKRVE